jgi:hypothetical protein
MDHMLTPLDTEKGADLAFEPFKSSESPLADRPFCDEKDRDQASED